MKEQKPSFNDQFNDSEIDIDNIIKTLKKDKENLDSIDTVGQLIKSLYGFVDLVYKEDTYRKLNSLINSYRIEELQSDDSQEKKNIERDKYHLKWTFTNKGGKGKPNLNYKKCKENWKRHLNDLIYLYEVGDKLYTLSIYDIISNVIKMLHDLYGDNINPIKPYYNVSIVLGEILYKHNFTPQRDGSSEKKSPNINITKSYLHKLDGMDSLLVNLGDKKFIELAIAGSYFFDPGLVKEEIKNLTNVFCKSEKKRKELSRPNVNLESSIDFGGAEKDVRNFVSEKIFGIEKEQKDNLQKVNKLINNLTVEKYKEYLLSNPNLPEPKEKELVIYLAKQFRNEIREVGESTPQDDNQILEYLKDTYKPTKKTLAGLKSRYKLNEYLAAMQLAKLDSFRADQIKEMNYLKARYTIDGNIVGDNTTLKKGDKAVYTIEDPNSKEKIKFMVHIDRDGNRFVRNLITDKTGITVSQGKDSVLQNTIISHVWGRAYDPRYFTSLWNIVLVPAWANSLMDKEDAPAETLASKMRATYMQLCTTLYNEYQESKESKKGVFPGNVEGNYLSGLPEVKNKEDVISGDFSFNVISESKKYIKIYTKNIKIENQTTIKI